MELQKFNSSNVDSRRRKYLAKVIINRYGLFRFSKSFVQAAGFSVGDKIALLQNKNELGDWYVTRDTETGLILRDGKHGGLAFNSSDLKDRILESAGEQKDSAIYALVTVPEKRDGMELYAIITRKNRSRQ